LNEKDRSNDKRKDSRKSREELLYHVLVERAMEPFARYKVICSQGEGCDVEFMDINPAYERVMGVKKEDVVGKRFRDVWPNAEDCWMDIIVQTIKTGKSVRHEAWSKDTGRYLEAVAFPLFSDEVAVLFLDRTNWKKAELELKEKERVLLEYRQNLRELATKLSLAEADTRRKIAVRIHDRIGYALIDILNRLRTLGEGNLDELEDIKAAVEGLLEESRNLTFETASPLLYEVGLDAAIEELAEKLLRDNGIDFSFQVSQGNYDVDERICILLYEMTRELLVNVIKHAEASFVDIRVHRTSEKIMIIVEDNGRGFSPESMSQWGKSKGFGLFSIKERLLPLGGKIKVLSEPGRGTGVYIEVPLGKEGLSKWLTN